jgi:hypothetical protein
MSIMNKRIVTAGVVFFAMVLLLAACSQKSDGVKGTDVEEPVAIEANGVNPLAVTADAFKSFAALSSYGVEIEDNSLDGSVEYSGYVVYGESYEDSIDYWKVVTKDEELEGVEISSEGATLGGNYADKTSYIGDEYIDWIYFSKWPEDFGYGTGLEVGDEGESYTNFIFPNNLLASLSDSAYRVFDEITPSARSVIHGNHFDTDTYWTEITDSAAKRIGDGVTGTNLRETLHGFIYDYCAEDNNYEKFVTVNGISKSGDLTTYNYTIDLGSDELREMLGEYIEKNLNGASKLLDSDEVNLDGVKLTVKLTLNDEQNIREISYELENPIMAGSLSYTAKFTDLNAVEPDIAGIEKLMAECKENYDPELAEKILE